MEYCIFGSTHEMDIVLLLSLLLPKERKWLLATITFTPIGAAGKLCANYINTFFQPIECVENMYYKVHYTNGEN